MGLAPKMSPNRPGPRGQILRRFPEPSAKRPPWLKSRVLSLRYVLGSRAGRSTMIHRESGGFSSSSAMHRRLPPQAPWPEEQSWLKRKTFAALPRKSCRLTSCSHPRRVAAKWSAYLPGRRSGGRSPQDGAPRAGRPRRHRQRPTRSTALHTHGILTVCAREPSPHPRSPHLQPRLIPPPAAAVDGRV